eukprot:scaffold25754_cov104-Isochrysis_galbana.AAC.1
MKIAAPPRGSRWLSCVTKAVHPLCFAILTTRDYFDWGAFAWEAFGGVEAVGVADVFAPSFSLEYTRHYSHFGLTAARVRCRVPTPFGGDSLVEGRRRWGCPPSLGVSE